MIKAYTHHPLGLAVVLGIKCDHDHSFRVSLSERETGSGVYVYYKQGGERSLPPAAPDSDTFHHIATYLHTCML